MRSERLRVPLLAVAAAIGIAVVTASGAEARERRSADAAVPARGQDPDQDAPPTDPETRAARPGPEGLPEWFSWFEGRFTGHANGAAQGRGSLQLRDSFGYRAYGEQARFEAEHVIAPAAMIDAGGTLRVWRDLSVGAGYAALRTTGAATLSGAVPHPIRSGAFRALPPQALSFDHRERVAHVVVAWRMPIIERFDASFFLGPSFYSVTQGVVTNVTVREAGGPPFAEVRVDQVQVGEHTRNAVGGHVGVDVTYMPTRHVGFGLLLRYAAASVKLPSAGEGGVVLRVGGAEVGGGMRIRF